MGKRVWQYPEVTGITNDDVILVDSPTGGSRSIKANKIGSVLINKTLTERGTFDAADDNVDGYKKVTVDVPYTDVKVASGPVASWDDGEDLPLKSLTSFIEPQQEGSGDTSPANVRPISGWTEANVSVSGVNVWDEEWELDATYRLSSKNYIPVKPNTTYLFCNTMLYSITGFDINKNNVGGPSLTQIPNVGFTFTTKSNWAYIKFNVENSYGTTYNNDISINYPSTDTEYHTYNGSTYKVEFKDGTNPLTVYGGTLDLVSGKLTVDRGYVDLGTLDWTYTSETNRERFSVSFSGVKWVSNTTPINAICSALVVTDFQSVYNHIKDNAIGMWNGTTLAVCSSAYTDATTFKTAMNGVQLVYELATPQTYQLTPTQVNSLLGTNNVWADTGDVDVEYQKIWVRPSA